MMIKNRRGCGRVENSVEGEMASPLRFTQKVREDMSEIFLIRHGQASFGAKVYDELSPTGIRQARILADHLIAHNVEFDAVYSGSMKRQVDTARAFCEQSAGEDRTDGRLLVMEAFNEYNARGLLLARIHFPGRSETLSVDDLPALRRDRHAFQAYFAETVYRWLCGEYDGIDGVEPWKAFCGRVSDGLQQIINRHGSGKRVAVFTSGGAISVMLKMVLGLSDRRTMETSYQIMNASLTSIKYNATGLALSMFNNTTHLLLEKDPGLLTYR
jgi:broad specificity phosphatase PhoE